MSNDKNYKLSSFYNPSSWNGVELDKDVINSLIKGDIVRLCFEFADGSLEKYYVEITNIDYNKLKKPKKFYGKLTKLYNEIINNDDIREIVFTKENILEIPKYMLALNSKSNNFIEFNFNEIMVCDKNKKIEILEMINNFINRVKKNNPNMTNIIITAYLVNKIDQDIIDLYNLYDLIDIYSIGKINKECLQQIFDEGIIELANI
jgi:hypothetical protein